MNDKIEAPVLDRTPKKADKPGYRAQSKCDYCDSNFPVTRIADPRGGGEKRIYAARKVPNGLRRCGSCEAEAVLKLAEQAQKNAEKMAARRAKKDIKKYV